MNNKETIREYNLPDAVLLTDFTTDYRCMIWEPDFTAIILGQSNGLEDSVYTDRAETDGVPVFKRPSGGETVLLSPHTIAISILKRGDALRSPRLYFNYYNEKIMAALESLGVKNLSSKGISDICLNNKKILGSAIYRNKDIVLYHAVLNRAESTDTMERYLKHPLREPDYRMGRTHGDFVTSLNAMGYSLPATKIKESLQYYLRVFQS